LPAPRAHLTGSPPRVRGTVCARPSSTTENGITPACAGNSQRFKGIGAYTTDHPRVCGEQPPMACPAADPPGSPPRVRGTADSAESYDARIRITPACAGNSCTRTCTRAWPGDHPRVCGEQPHVVCQPVALMGSPPRVRGTGSDAKPLSSLVRITPACAGNSFAFTRGDLNMRDHPRVCGEQVVSVSTCVLWLGSPPRVRGTATLHQPLLGVPGSPPRVRGTDTLKFDRMEGHRITPACAGNRHVECLSESHLEDHPRVCGEQECAPPTSHLVEGSPPRVRGTGKKVCKVSHDGRITPACAGNRVCQDDRRNGARDHPRVCGEQPWPDGDKGTRQGSPPRVRGTGL